MHTSSRALSAATRSFRPGRPGAIARGAGRGLALLALGWGLALGTSQAQELVEAAPPPPPSATSRLPSSVSAAVTSAVSSAVSSAVNTALQSAAGAASLVMPGTLLAGPEPTGPEEGYATWYGPRFHGKRTASGERFNMHALTAAHPTLPFGTLLRVRSLTTGKEVTVRVNDRGPFSPGLIIDLSKAAAQAIGLFSVGTKEVAVTVLDSQANAR